MSAYIVEQKTIGFIVNAAINYGIIKREDAIKTAMMLWKENQNSVQYRYKDADYSRIGQIRSFGHLGTFNEYKPSQVRSSCKNLEYQSSEHPAWESSESYRLLDRIINVSIHINGNDSNYDIWGAPDPIKITEIKF